VLFATVKKFFQPEIKKKRKKFADDEFNLKIVSHCSGKVRRLFNYEIQYLMEL
jgi:hypothetical protein